VLVTVGTGAKKFSTGFDLKYWSEGLPNILKSSQLMCKLYAKLIKLPMTTMVVMNGTTMAGGLILSLCHDFRVMIDSPKAKLCLTEINIGVPLSPGYAAVVQGTLDIQASRIMSLGHFAGPKEALALNVVTDLYSNPEEIQKKIW